MAVPCAGVTQLCLLNAMLLLCNHRHEPGRPSKTPGNRPLNIRGTVHKWLHLQYGCGMGDAQVRGRSS